jgi:hypothetical protein
MVRQRRREHHLVVLQGVQRQLLAPAGDLAHAQGAHHAVRADQAEQAPFAFARMLVGAGEIGRVDLDDGDAGKVAVGVVDAAREVQMRFGLGGVADGPADVQGAAVGGAVHGEVGLVRDVDRRGGGIAGHHGPVAVGDGGHEQHRGRQQAVAVQRGQRAVGAVLFGRVLEQLEGLVDAVQAARHLRLEGVDQFAARRARGGCAFFAFGVDEVEGRDPQRCDQREREDRQRDVGLQHRREPPRPAGGTAQRWRRWRLECCRWRLEARVHA